MIKKNPTHSNDLLLDPPNWQHLPRQRHLPRHGQVLCHRFPRCHGEKGRHDGHASGRAVLGHRALEGGNKKFFKFFQTIFCKLLTVLMSPNGTKHMSTVVKIKKNDAKT